MVNTIAERRSPNLKSPQIIDQHIIPEIQIKLHSPKEKLSARSDSTNISSTSKKSGSDNNNDGDDDDDGDNDSQPDDHIPEVYKTQGAMPPYSPSTGYSDTVCPCSTPLDPKAVKITEDRRNWIATDRLYALRRKAQEAIKNHKTFAIRGCFYSIRKSLIHRGWIEKLDIHRRHPVTQLCHDVVDEMATHLPVRKPGETRRQHLQKCERNIMSRFLEHKPIDFLWTARKERQDYIDIARNPSITVNKFTRNVFSTKEGLCNVLKDFHWYFQEGVSETYAPRTYNVWSQDGLSEFTDNFRLTACIASLRFLIDSIHANGIESMVSIAGKIPASIFNFAIKQCRAYIRTSLHCDIDEEQELPWDHDWETFLSYYSMMTQENEKIKIDQDCDAIRVLVPAIEHLLQELSVHWPQFNLDGNLNIWIIKPSNRCRGRGIILMNDFKKIVNFVNPPIVNKIRYVIQKYIERPLIIYNCKFDIRQWFLVTSVQPLIIWMYKESYLRFSSQEFSLINFHESVHLTNHAVQKRYKNGKRDERLPRENMWDCHTFQAYLRQIGKAEMWSKRIYPGMQKALIGLCLASQDTMDRRSNTFELFGADFVVSEDCQPWLIEINSSPDLGASTSVTARLCPQALEDVIKVVIDHRNNPRASTGGFEMIYRQVIPPAPAYLGLNLFLKGNAIQSSKNANGKKEKRDIIKGSTSKLSFSAIEKKINNLTFSEATNPATQPQSQNRPFIVDFIECINGAKAEKPIIAIRRPNKIKCLITSKKSKELENMITAQKAKAVSGNGITGPGARYLKILTDNLDKKAKSNIYARRHASCGSKRSELIGVLSASDDRFKENDSDNNIPSISLNTSTSAVRDFECVGNRCCMKNLPLINIEPHSFTSKFPISRIIESDNQLKPAFPIKMKSPVKKKATKVHHAKKSIKTSGSIKS